LTGIVSPAFSALYDGDGLRAMKQGTLPGGTSAITPYFLYGPDGMPIVEEGWNGTSASVTAANGMGAAGWRERYAGSQKTAYADDPSGSVLARVTAGDTTSPADSYSFYDGYGDVRGYVQVSTGQRLVVRDPVGFGSQYGYYTDPETGNGTTAPGLLCLTHRYYDPGTGRFVTRDPSGYGGGVNLYGFAGDNPVNEMDPDGLRRIYIHNPHHFAPAYTVVAGNRVLDGRGIQVMAAYNHRDYVIDIPNSQSLAANMDFAVQLRGGYYGFDYIGTAQDLLAPYVANGTYGDYGKNLKMYPSSGRNKSLAYMRQLGGNFNLGVMGAAAGVPLQVLLASGHVKSFEHVKKPHPQPEQDAIEDGFYYFYQTHPQYEKSDDFTPPSGVVINLGPPDHDPN
jgi:RHS repeat-associated protein